VCTLWLDGTLLKLPMMCLTKSLHFGNRSLLRSVSYSTFSYFPSQYKQARINLPNRTAQFGFSWLSMAGWQMAEKQKQDKDKVNTVPSQNNLLKHDRFHLLRIIDWRQSITCCTYITHSLLNMIHKKFSQIFASRSSTIAMLSSTAFAVIRDPVLWPGTFLRRNNMKSQWLEMRAAARTLGGDPLSPPGYYF
jgi:hypothetical protein